jgi:hypothetical protein
VIPAEFETILRRVVREELQRIMGAGSPEPAPQPLTDFGMRKAAAYAALEASRERRARRAQKAATAT